MKILVTVLLTALFVFALATTWVDIVQPQLDQRAQAKAESAVPRAEATSARKRPRKVAAPIEPELLPVPTDEASSAEGPASSRVESGSRTRKSAKETAELVAQKLEDVKEQESRLAARQEALRMIYDDIRDELSAVDSLRKRTNEELAEAEQRVLAAAEHKTPQLTNSRSAPSAPRIGESQANRSQAMFVRRLVEDGKMETAVSVLKAMKARDAAGVLASLSALDSKLAVRLADTVQSNRDDTVRR